MVVCHLRAHPERQEEIIAGYLQSPEVLKDTVTLGEFFAFWLREFFQKANTGPVEELGRFIKNSAQKSLPPELHRARREIFEPLFASLSSKEREIFEKVKEIGLFGTGQNLAQALLEQNQPLSESLKTEYQKFVSQLVKIEAGIIPVGPAEPEPKTTKRPKNKSRPSQPSPPTLQPETSPPSTAENNYSFFIVLGPNTEPILVENQQVLERLMKKIKGLPDAIATKEIWQRLNELSKMSPDQIFKRYRERVAGGPFEGWYKIPLGRKWWILFSLQNNEIFFRVGSHETVYATRRRKPRDRARSL